MNLEGNTNATYVSQTWNAQDKRKSEERIDALHVQARQDDHQAKNRSGDKTRMRYDIQDAMDGTLRGTNRLD